MDAAVQFEGGAHYAGACWWALDWVMASMTQSCCLHWLAHRDSPHGRKADLQIGEQSLSVAPPTQSVRGKPSNDELVILRHNDTQSPAHDKVCAKNDERTTSRGALALQQLSGAECLRPSGSAGPEACIFPAARLTQTITPYYRPYRQALHALIVTHEARRMSARSAIDKRRI